MVRTPLIRPAEAQLRPLMQTLEIDLVRLTECVVSPGYRLAFPGGDTASVHYNLAGTGRIVVGAQPPVVVVPHKLVIVPAREPFRFEVDGPGGRLATLDLRRPAGEAHGAFHRFEAGEGEPRMTLVCGNFRARRGGGPDLFADLRTPVVEQFAPADRLDERMKDAVAELLAQEQGEGTMAASLLKQVVVKLLRRSIASNELWVEQLSALQDPQIARAFASMLARPGAEHTVETLAEAAGMSRSVFMERFTRLFGRSPMAVLRHLRLEQARASLEKPGASLDRAAREAGYANRISFRRAFREEFGREPTDHAPGAR